MVSTPTVEKSNGLATYVSVLTSPVSAFSQLSRTPTWGWAALIGISLFVATILLSFPEQMKVAHIQQQLAYSTMSADQRAQATSNPGLTDSITKIAIFAVGFIAPWIIWIISAIVFAIGAAIAGAGARFGGAWVASVNASAPAFVAAVVNALIISLRGPDSVSGPADLYALPSLSMLVHGGAKLTAFLNAYNLGNIWYYVVAVIALERMLNVKRPASIVTVVVYSLISAGFGAAFAK